MNEITITDKRASSNEARSVINTSTSTAPASWLLNLASSANATGINVTRENAFTVSHFWKACMLITTAVAKCPTHIYSINGNTRTLNTKHPAYKLMRTKPNKFQRAYDFKQQMQLHLLLYGNAYAVIILNERGQPTELLPLLPETVSIIDKPEGRYYVATMYFSDGQTEVYVLDSSQMLHLTSMSYDGVTGYGLVNKARESLGQLLAMQSHAGSFFKNGARPGSILKHPNRLNKEGKKALRESYEEAYSGSHNAYKTLVLDEGMDLQMVGQTARDSQFVELWQQCGRDVANYFCLPPSKLGDSSRNAYNTLEQDALAALSDCYDGHIINWQEALNEKLLSTKDQETGANVFMFDTSSLLAVDLKTKGEYLAKATGNNTAWYTQDEARAYDGLNPLGGTAGELPMPGNGAQQQPADDPAETPDDEETDTEDDARSAALDVLREAAQRALTKGMGEIRRAHKAGGIAAAMQTLASEREGREKIIASSVRLLAIINKDDTAALSRDISEKLGAVMLGCISSHMSESPEQFQSSLQNAGDTLAMEIRDYADRITLRRGGKTRTLQLACTN